MSNYNAYYDQYGSYTAQAQAQAYGQGQAAAAQYDAAGAAGAAYAGAQAQAQQQYQQATTPTAKQPSAAADRWGAVCTYPPPPRHSFARDQVQGTK